MEKPEALRLAEFCYGNVLYQPAAAELRRQHGEIKSMQAERLRSERRLLDVEAQRDALLEALKEVLAWGTDQNYVRAKAACDKARDAIKAVEEENT